MSGSSLGSAVALSLAALAGAAVMSVELAAVRLLAPWFGTSLTVWTNVIGVLLLALAVGNLLGGALARSGDSRVRLDRLLCLAGAWVLVLPSLVGSVGDWLVPDQLSLHGAADVLGFGSLAASGLLFIPPAILLGTVGPLAVEIVQRARGGSAGRAGGFVLAVATAGSLVGTFGTSHLLLPELGVANTFRIAGGALVVAAVVDMLAHGFRNRPSLATLCLAGAAAAAIYASLNPPSAGAALAPGLTLLERSESPYQRVRVVEDARYEPLARYLQVNEGSDSYQSVWVAQPGLLPDGYYYNDFALPLAWTAAADGAPEEWRVLVLGLGGGTALRVLDGTRPTATRLRSIGVEIDPVVVELAREHMELPTDDSDTTILSGWDARAALRSEVVAEAAPFDQVVLDCYANQVEIPPHLSSVEFLAEVREQLAVGGWVVANVGGFGLDDPVVQALGSTLSRAFESEVLGLIVKNARNVSLIARRGADVPKPASESFMLDTELGLRLLASREAPGRWCVFDGDESVELTDDMNPIVALQVRSIREARARMRGELEALDR